MLDFSLDRFFRNDASVSSVLVFYEKLQYFVALAYLAGAILGHAARSVAATTDGTNVSSITSFLLVDIINIVYKRHRER